MGFKHPSNGLYHLPSSFTVFTQDGRQFSAGCPLVATWSRRSRSSAGEPPTFPAAPCSKLHVVIWYLICINIQIVNNNSNINMSHHHDICAHHDTVQGKAIWSIIICPRARPRRHNVIQSVWFSLVIVDQSFVFGKGWWDCGTIKGFRQQLIN